jgi:hypothetical protein
MKQPTHHIKMSANSDFGIEVGMVIHVLPKFLCAEVLVHRVEA